MAIAALGEKSVVAVPKKTPAPKSPPGTVSKATRIAVSCNASFLTRRRELCVRFALVESELAQRRQSVRLPCGPSSRAWRHTCARTTSLRRRADLRGRTAATFAGTDGGSCGSQAERHPDP